MAADDAADVEFHSLRLIRQSHIATLSDGIAHQVPDGTWFRGRAEEAGFKTAVQEHDRGEPIAPHRSRRMKTND